MKIRTIILCMLFLAAADAAFCYLLISSEKALSWELFSIVFGAVAGLSFSIVGLMSFIGISMRLGWSVTKSKDLNLHRKQIIELFFSGLCLAIGSILLINYIATHLN